MRWPWPWPNNLGTQTWPRYGQDVTSYQKWSFYVNWFKSYSPNRHADTTKTLPPPLTREVKIGHVLMLGQYQLNSFFTTTSCKWKSVHTIFCLLSLVFSFVLGFKCQEQSRQRYFYPNKNQGWKRGTNFYCFATSYHWTTSVRHL